MLNAESCPEIEKDARHDWECDPRERDCGDMYNLFSKSTKNEQKAVLKLSNREQKQKDKINTHILENRVDDHERLINHTILLDFAQTDIWYF